jgi:hypothetical protein
MRKNKITPVLERWREAEREGRPFCIAINEYPLYLLRLRAKECLPDLAEELDLQSREPLVYGESRGGNPSTIPLLVIDLSLRNPLSSDISKEMLDKILHDQPIAGTPSLDYNKKRLSDPVVKQRLLAIFRRLADIGVRVTMRELWILLARLVLGYRGDLKDTTGSSLDYRYVEVLFSKDSRFALGSSLAFADPAKHSHPIWDAMLEERHESTIKGWNFGVPVLGVADRPDRKIFQALKRSFYFEHDDGEVCFALDDPDAAEFRNLLRSASNSNMQIKRQLVHGLNRAFCTQDFAGCEDNLYLWNGHRFHEQSSRSFLAHRFIPGVRLDLLHPRIPTRVAGAFPEYEPDHLILRYQAADGLSARLRIDFSLFRTLQRLRRGLPRKLLPEGEAFRLDAFIEALTVSDADADQRILSAHLERKELIEIEMSADGKRYERVAQHA